MFTMMACPHVHRLVGWLLFAGVMMGSVIVRGVDAAVTVYARVGAGPGGDGLSRTAPFNSAQQCADAMVAGGPGSECVLLSGGGRFRLREPIVVDGVDGGGKHGFVIRGEEEDDDEEGTGGGPTTLDGTVSLSDDAGSGGGGGGSGSLAGDGWAWVPGTILPNGRSAPIGHWRAVLAPGVPEPWALFSKPAGSSASAKEDMYVPARWPNARWDDKTVFQAKYWARDALGGGSTYVSPNVRTNKPGASYGPDWSECLMVDATEDNHPSGNSVSLASSGLNATGAAAVLNIGHWYTHSAKVHSHEPGSSNFTYLSRPDWKVVKYVAGHNLYFLEGKPEFIDQDKEWTYDPSTRELRVAVPGGRDVHPNTLGLSGRVLEYGAAITGCRGVTLKNLRFFAVGVYAASEYASRASHNITFERLTLDYPSNQKRVLGDVDTTWPGVTHWQQGAAKKANVDFEMRECEVHGAEGPALRINGGGVRIVQNTFTYNDWTAVTGKDFLWEKNATTDNYGPSGLLLLGDAPVEHPTLFERNDVFHTGNSAIVYPKDNNVVRLNHVKHAYDVQNDGAMVQANGVKAHLTGDGSELVFERNWCTDALNERNNKWGLRFDRDQSNCNLARPGSTGSGGFNGRILHNVVVRVSGVSVKGNNHTVSRNLINGANGIHGEEAEQGNKAPIGLMIYSWWGPGGGNQGEPSLDGMGTCQCVDAVCANPPYNATCCVDTLPDTYENNGTIVTGNVIDQMGATVDDGGGGGAVDAIFKVRWSSGNSAGYWRELTFDVDAEDYRAEPGSAAALNNLGPYGWIGHGGEYWIPGRQRDVASKPVPPHGYANARPTSSMMFLSALGATSHVIHGRAYITEEEKNAAAGRDSSNAAAAPSMRRFGRLTSPANVWDMRFDVDEPWPHGTIVEWRVDAEFPDGRVAKGETWNFTVRPASPPPSPPPPLPPHLTFPWKMTSDGGGGVPILGGGVKVDSLRDVDASYPSGYVLRGVRVCVNLSFAETTTPRGVDSLQIWFVSGVGTSDFVYTPLMRRQGGGATALKRTCFQEFNDTVDALGLGDDAAAINAGLTSVPNDAPGGNPTLTGAWASRDGSGLLAQASTGSIGRETTTLGLRVKDLDGNATLAATTLGNIASWSLELFWTPPPSPPPNPPPPPRPPPPPPPSPPPPSPPSMPSPPPSLSLPPSSPNLSPSNNSAEHPKGSGTTAEDDTRNKQKTRRKIPTGIIGGITGACAGGLALAATVQYLRRWRLESSRRRHQARRRQDN